MTKRKMSSPVAPKADATGQEIESIPASDARKSFRPAVSDNKAARRARLLEQMPKGGVAVEIGVWRGKFSRTILETVTPERLYLIDPWKRFHEHHERAISGRTSDSRMDAIHAEVCRRYAKEIKANQVVVLRQMSTDALAGFADETISFAYVDGDHSYEGVKADLASLWPKMTFGGVMAFDDYNRRGWWGDGVLQAIHEFIGQKTLEIRVMSVIGAQIALRKIGPAKR